MFQSRVHCVGQAEEVTRAVYSVYSVLHENHFSGTSSLDIVRRVELRSTMVGIVWRSQEDCVSLRGSSSDCHAN